MAFRRGAESPVGRGHPAAQRRPLGPLTTRIAVQDAPPVTG
jgi:hypothetical protein